MVFFFIANMVASIVVIFESRFYTVCEFSWEPYWKRWRKIGIIFYHVVQSCVILALVFFAPDQETAKRNLFAQLPCLPQYIYDANIFVLCDKETYRMLFLLTAIILASVMVVSFAILLVWNILVQLRSRIMSQNTFQLQKSFLIALGVQIVVPLCTIVIPVAYAEIAIVFNYYNQSFTNFAVCLLSMHGFLSSMVMVLVHRPYRDTLLSFFEENMTVQSGEHSVGRFLRYQRDVSAGAVIVTTRRFEIL